MVYFSYMQEHPAYTQTLTHYLSLLTFVGVGILVCAAIVVAYLWFKKDLEKYARCLGDYIFPIGFLTTLFGVLLTIFYQYWLGYAPCDLCWFQRVFLYPQLFIFGYAWYKKDRAALPYTLILSLVGLAIAAYHHMLQIGFDLMKPCSTAPFAVDCAKPSFIEFGFVTFPFMAVVLFAFLLLIVIVSTKISKRN